MNLLYLSPHLDDAVLSCGGTIACQVAAGENVRIVVLFAADPDLDNLSAYAQETHDLWGNPPRPYATRRAEDRAAIARLGAAYLHLGFPDAIYRRTGGGIPLYTGDASLFGTPHPADDALVARLEGVLRPIVTGRGLARLYAPLAVGRHVDHWLVGRVARRLACAPEVELWYYEDFPYATGDFPRHAPDSVQATLERYPVQDWEVWDVSIEPERKIEAISCYTSQIASLFEDEEGMERAVRDYAAALNAEQAYTERFRRPLSPCPDLPGTAGLPACVT
jgi:LmbE family N-acetylglucosaminyl deacetylase